MNKLFAAVLLVSAALAPVFSLEIFNSDVENVAVECPVTLPNSFTTANTMLPDPFLKLDGTRISDKADWWCLRQEILKLAERTVYGTKPPKPASVTGTVTNSQITVNVSEGGKTASFSADITLPTTGTAPYPAVIMFGNSGANAAIIRGQGVATINFSNSSVGSESGSRANKTGAFYTIYGSNSKTGLLGAWAWGVSRFIDVIEQSDGKILRADAIGVTGCSRLGKAAFAAGAFDQRVALTMPMESGSGGMNIMRGAYADRDQSGGSNGAQSPSSAYNETYWLGDDFNAFMNNPNNLPIDMHQIVAMIAPRGFLVLDKTAASSGQWLNIPSSHAAALAGAEVYKALGFGGNFHYINTPTTSHCQWAANIYDAPLQDFIQKFLLRTKAADGTAPLFTATTPPNMTKWVNWTAPELTGELGDGSGTVLGVVPSTKPTAPPLRAAAPQNSAVTVNFRASCNGESVLKLYNLKGNVISAAKIQTAAGKNYAYTFNTGKLPNGFYTVDLYSGGSVEQTRVIIPK